MKTGENIRKRRKELHMTVDELAEKIGKDRATVYRYENGDIESLPARKVLIPLAEALRTTPAELLGYEGEYTTVYKDNTFLLQMKGRKLKDSAEAFLSEYLKSVSEELRPSRSHILSWLRAHVGIAAYHGGSYEDMDDDSLFAFYEDVRNELENDKDGD